MRILTVSKKQEIDVFFTESKSETMNTLFEPHVTTVLDVDVKAIEIGHVKLAKIWIKHVSFPWLPKDDDLSSRQKERRETMSILYKEESR